MIHRIGESKKFAAIAQAVYRRDGDWTGSVGLRSVLIDAPDKAAAEVIARSHYMKEWNREHAKGGVELLNLHVSVEEAWWQS